jgi:hypothetical protein
MAATGKALKSKMGTNDGHMIHAAGKGAVNKGNLGPNTNYSNESAFEEVGAGGSKDFNGRIGNMDSWQKSVNLDDPGFDASGGCYIKKGTPFGEAAMFNQLPPGMDISDQAFADIRDMKLKMVTEIGYPGDGAFAVRDVTE